MNNKILFFIIAALSAGSMLMYAEHHHDHHHAVMHHDMSDAHIAGHVLDAQTGEHLPFVNVQVEGTTLGCLTDESGHFYLKNLPEGDLTLIFSMMGY